MQQTDSDRPELRRAGVRDGSSKISLTCSTREEMSQSGHKHDTAPHSETPSLSALHVVSISGIASHISGMVTTCESAQISADIRTGGDVTTCTWNLLSSSLTLFTEMLVWIIQYTLKGI